MSDQGATPDRYARSRAQHDRRLQVVAGGVNSNVRLDAAPLPLTFARAQGALVWDVDGNEYVDYAAGMGPMILGHCHPEVTAAVERSLSTGQLFAGQSELEAELAELLVGVIPWIESIRTGLTGTEMNLLAVRIARAATGRRKVVRFAGHYHGWLDPLFVDMGSPAHPDDAAPITAGQSVAAASEIVVCDWNEVGQLARVLESGEVACVLMEPVMCNTGLIPPAPGYLEAVKELCAAAGALFVVDEVITGFRLGPTGAQGFLGVHGDISIYAKAIASGFPLAVLGTTEEVLAPVGRGEVNHSGTYNAGVSSLAAGIATLRYLIDANPYPEIERRTRQLVDGLRDVGAEHGATLAVDHIGGSLFQTRFGSGEPVGSLSELQARSDTATQTRFLLELLDLGIRPTSRGMWFVSSAHDEAVIARTLAAADEAISGL